MATVDAIVIGGGHNGLTCATLLAKRGQRVVVLEARDTLGGLASSDVFHPGYRSAGILHDTTRVSQEVIAELGLEEHGLERRREGPDVVLVGKPDEYIILHANVEDAAADIARVSFADSERYLDYCAAIDHVSPVLRSFFRDTPVDVTHPTSAGPWELVRRGLALRQLGKQDMLELMRLPPMCVADWLDEWFETDLLKVGLALPALGSTFTGPRSPYTNMNLLMWESTAESDILGSGPALIDALERAARAAGVEIRTGARVDQIELSAHRVTGVTLAGGDSLAASTVVASCHPTQVFLEQVPQSALSRRLEHRFETYRSRGTTAHVLLALNAPFRLDAMPGIAVEFARVCPGLDHLERAFDAVKYGQMSEAPALELHVPTIADPSLAPEGHAVLAVTVHHAPYDLREGWSDTARERIYDRVMESLEAHCQGLRSRVVGHRVRSPLDIETEFGTVGGHLHHGEHALDQLLVRPAPECARYATPFDGLFLCGSGSHPGGGLTCAPGAMAADAITG